MREKPTRKIRNQEIMRFEMENEPLGDCGCPHCGAANASHEGNIYHDGLYVGDAWNCNECLTNYWCSIDERGE